MSFSNQDDLLQINEKVEKLLLLVNLQQQQINNISSENECFKVEISQLKDGVIKSD